MPLKSTLSFAQRKVLELLSKQASDGYTVVARTGLSIDEVMDAVSYLADMQLVRVHGEYHNGKCLLSAYLAVPPNIQAYVNLILKVANKG